MGDGMSRIYVYVWNFEERDMLEFGVNIIVMPKHITITENITKCHEVTSAFLCLVKISV